MKRKRPSHTKQQSVNKLSEGAGNVKESLHISRGEIRFVLPRSPPNMEMVQFLFPRQQVLASDDLAHKKEKARHSPVGERKSKQDSESGGTDTRPRSDGDGASETRSILIEGEQQSEKSRNESLVLSVEDAVRDKAGWRPRANSTDGELKLPRRGLCDEHIVLQSHVWDMDRLYDNRNGKGGPARAPPPRGLVNLGNTCFMNATLQCLAYMPTFCQLITSLPATRSGGSANESSGGVRRANHGLRITMLLRSLLRVALGITAREKGEAPRASPVTPKTIHKAIICSKINGHRFRPGRQEDAHELLVHLLDAMHEGELVAAGIDPHARGWRDSLPIPRLDETTFVRRVFGGYFRSQLRCNLCDHKSTTYDPFLDLALEVSKKHIDSLSAAFTEFTRKEKLDAQNRWKCSGCKKNVCPTKHLSVFRPPLSLCIHLKRFGFEANEPFLQGGWGFGHRNGKGFGMMGNGGGKISKRITFPAQLSLPLSDGRKCQYILTGVIVHVGHSARTGHYTSYVKQPGTSAKWCHMDDSYVQTVSEGTVLKQRDAYVLFYTRKEVKLEFPPPPRETAGKHNSPSTSANGQQNNMRVKNPIPSLELSKSKFGKEESFSPKSDLAALKLANEASYSSSGRKSADDASSLGRNSLHDIKRSLSYKNSNKKKFAKQRRPWNPPKINSDSLLAHVNVGGWGDTEDHFKTRASYSGEQNSLRSTAMKQMEMNERGKKRKMRVGYWDSLIDEVKTKKKKDRN